MLKPLAPDLWRIDAAPLRLPGRLRLPVASTVIRLPDRTLLVYSPVRVDDVTAAALAAEGEVAHIVAPNLLHHLYVGPLAERFPRAIIHAAPGLAAKRPDLRIARELGTPDPAWGDAVDAVLIDGAPRINEAVLFHRPSGTLVCADLLFNVTRPENLATRMILAATGAGGRKLAQSRMWTLAVRNRDAARASLDRILAWPIERVAPVHGEVAEIDAAGLAPLLSRAYRGTARPGHATPTSG